MQTIEFITLDDVSKEPKDRMALVWCRTNNLKVFRDFMQYVLDDLKNPQDFMIVDVEKDLVYNMYEIATKQYNMRKRTFEERMKNIQTGKWFGVKL